uniref:Uncharacterized protein n=1 Tax=Megaselia scalaris TaxID=36166 RepID=T1GB83_MEGSC
MTWKFLLVIVISVLNVNYAQATRSRRSVFHTRWNPNEKFVVESKEKPAINGTKLSPHPRFDLSKNRKLTIDPKVYRCFNKYQVSCQNKTTIFKSRILSLFRKSMKEYVNATNIYNVEFSTMLSNFEGKYYPSSCLLLEAGVRVLRRKDPPFNKLRFGKLFPKKKIFKDIKKIKTCAIVSSAGSLSGSKLGSFI